MDHIPAFELLGHRVVWGLPCFFLWLLIGRRAPELRDAVRDRAVLRTLVLSSLVLAINWAAFIMAIEQGHVMQVSLGYFMNPLVSTLLGLVVLRERLRRLQWVAVLLAGAGALQLALRVEEVPWFSFVLATSFGLYGLVRKTARVEALPGTTLEMLLLLPPALAWLAILELGGHGHVLSADATTIALVLFVGPLSMGPLLWFANAARRLRLSILGFMQYIAPSGQFLLALLAYGEDFTSAHAIGFGAI